MLKKKKLDYHLFSIFKRKKDRNLEKFHNEKVLFIVSINVPIFLLGAHITWQKLQSSFLFYPFLCFIYTLVFKNVAIWKKYMKLIHLSFFNQIFQCTFRFLIKRCFFLMRKQNADIWYIFQLQNFRKRVCIYIYMHALCMLTSLSSLSTLAWLRWYHTCEITWGGYIALPPS